MQATDNEDASATLYRTIFWSALPSSQALHTTVIPTASSFVAASIVEADTDTLSLGGCAENNSSERKKKRTRLKPITNDVVIDVSLQMGVIREVTMRTLIKIMLLAFAAQMGTTATTTAQQRVNCNIASVVDSWAKRPNTKGEILALRDAFRGLLSNLRRSPAPASYPDSSFGTEKEKLDKRKFTELVDEMARDFRRLLANEAAAVDPSSSNCYVCPLQRNWNRSQRIAKDCQDVMDRYKMRNTNDGSREEYKEALECRYIKEISQEDIRDLASRRFEGGMRGFWEQFEQRFDFLKDELRKYQDNFDYTVNEKIDVFFGEYFSSYKNFNEKHKPASAKQQADFIEDVTKTDCVAYEPWIDTGDVVEQQRR